MKRWLWILAVLAVVGNVAVHTSRGQVPTSKPPIDLGPGEGGATLKLPNMDPGPGSAKPIIPPSMQGLWNPTTPAYPAVPAGGTKVALPPSNAVDINRDIEITPEAGQWLIFVMAYSGPKAPEMARKFVALMRGHYKWNAYVYNYGAKEKQAEYERVQKIRQEQIEALRREGLKTDIPIRVPAMRIDEQTGVLLGGYKTREEAMNALKILRDPKRMDPKGLIGKVELDTIYLAVGDETRTAKGLTINDSASSYVNPFTKAFPARNPSLPKELVTPTTEEDLRLLRKINADEPLSLMKCKKGWTLTIKQFNMQFKTLDKDKGEEVKGFLEKFSAGLIRQTGPKWEDTAAHNAHNLATAFRKAGLPDTYVLHARHCSYVTVGGYENMDDPQLTAMQNLLESRFKTDGFRALDLFPRPIPMPVPR